ncbi:MAG: UvrABC system protein C [Chlamydiia bacterium]|nr:UvrABC system protein C [Chlamydiia bacterium]MCH9615114.1 UvrABC system protein C [Chlamydiia bacterium]MCH9628564.1 UvrABC system protein C [Chlamydiia bacterium]
MKDKTGKVLYVGKAKNLLSRVKQYFIPGRDGREMVPYLTAKIVEIETIVLPSEKEALLLESTLIKKHQPQYNILLKDDKSFISLVVTIKDQWPMIKLVRSLGAPKGDGLHFGPYTSAFAARQTLDILQRIFPLRQCSDRELKSRKRACLLYSIKRCIAPCVNRCTKATYDEHVKRAIMFLKGQDKQIVKDLKAEMEKASALLEFEKAGAILRTLKQIDEVTTHRKSLVYSEKEETDVFNLVRSSDSALIIHLLFRDGKLTGTHQYKIAKTPSSDGELFESFFLQHKNLAKNVIIPLELSNKQTLEDLLGIKLIYPKIGSRKKLLDIALQNALTHSFDEDTLLDMQETLHLNRSPVQIECFDTSSISGTDIVASMVGFTDGAYDKTKKRLFALKTVDKSDDYGALREVLRRHYTKAKAEDRLPDLTIIDGGRGQFNVAKTVFNELDIASVDLISVVKEDAKHTRGLTQERVFIEKQQRPISLPPQSSVLLLLQRIRDEAHRAAISYHRSKRKKRTIQSALDTVPGIGPKKKALLLKHFGSVAAIKKATFEELREVPGLSEKDCRLLATLE